MQTDPRQDQPAAAQHANANANANANVDLTYWRSRPMSERIAEVERLRQQWLTEHDPDALTRPMEKVWRIAKLHDGDGS